ncbi:MAG: hypothetical protein IPI30_12390 [Saprospiraceae bacterium]|nr:hypothetical protein [Candidatus Vicinibacter affinis]
MEGNWLKSRSHALEKVILSFRLDLLNIKEASLEAFFFIQPFADYQAS